MLGSLAKSKASQLWRETGLSKGNIGHWEPQDFFDRISNHRIELDCVLVPLMEWGRPHEMYCAHNAVAHTKQVSRGLRVLKVHEPSHGREKPAQQLLLDKIRHKGIATQRYTQHLYFGMGYQLHLVLLSNIL